MDDAWKTNDPDADIDNIEEPLSIFDGLRKEFLFSKPFDGKNRDLK
jgi:hypothetical protein